MQFGKAIIDESKHQKEGNKEPAKVTEPLGGNEDNTSSKPKINIDFKMDTADIAKMNDGQRKSTGIYIDKLQGK